MDRKSKEWMALKNVLTRPGFLAAFRRASPLKTTSSNESFHSTLLMYIPKRTKMLVTPPSPFCTEESVKVKFDMLMKAFDLLLPMSRSLGSDLLDLVYGLDSASQRRERAALRESWEAINKLIVAHLGLDTDHAGETVH